MTRKVTAFWVALCLCILCGCQNISTEVTAKDGLTKILDGLIGKTFTEDVEKVTDTYFLDGELTPKGLQLHDYNFIVFKKMSYEIVSVKQKGTTATAKVKLTNNYLPMCLSYFWSYLDDEYDHVNDYDSIMYEALSIGPYYHTVTATLEMRYEVKEDNGSLAWGIVCSDETVNAFYGGIYDTDYVDNGYQYLVTDTTFANIEKLAEAMRDDFDKLNRGRMVDSALNSLEERCKEAAYYYEILCNCYSAWDYEASDDAIVLLYSLISHTTKAIDRGIRSFDLTEVVDEPLQAMKNH